MTSELKPCQFCGGEAETHETTDGWIVSCSSDQNVLDGFTHMAHAYGGTEAEAIAEWNKRAERTCKMETDYDELEVVAYSPEDTWVYKCSACDWSFRYDRGIKPNYCPICGRKVVGE